MAINYPGPYEIRINYTVALLGVTLTHQQRLSLRLAADPVVGTPFSGINALRRDDNPFPLDGEVDAWIALLQPEYNSTDADFVNAELWKYVPLTFDASFVSAYDIALPGTGVSATHIAGQTIMTFRTEEGGIMKVTMLEGISGNAARQPFTSMPTRMQNIADAVRFGTSPWIARDTSYPFSVIAAFPGENEAVFKKRYRGA